MVAADQRDHFAAGEPLVGVCAPCFHRFLEQGARLAYGVFVLVPAKRPLGVGITSPMTVTTMLSW